MNDRTPPSTAEPPALALVLPCYDEEAVLPRTHQQLVALLDDLVARGRVAPASTILYVDNGSRDATWTLIQTFARDCDYVRGMKLVHNVGHQNGLLAGLLHAEGDAVVSLDADLQDDIGVIEAMLEYHAAGAHIVYGVRSTRGSDTVLKRQSAQIFYRLLSLMGVEVIYNHADFRLMSRAALDALARHDERALYLRGIVPTLGFPSATVEYERRPRPAGESKYDLHQLVSLALNGVTALSVAPLRLIALMGVAASLLAMLAAAWVLGVRLFTDDAVPGWASTLLPVLFLGGVQLLSLGVVGEYVGRIYQEVKHRPRYHVERILGPRR